MLKKLGSIRATYPLSDHTLAVRFSDSDAAREACQTGLRLLSSQECTVQGVRDEDHSEVLVDVKVRQDSELLVDQILSGPRSTTVGPRFVHGVRSPMDLKVPFMDHRFPFRSTLEGVHVSVACCTGCNGGIHDRGLVVINNHSGGSWSGMWVRTPVRMPENYARWQKVEFVGGVLRDQGGSTEVVDEGWMQIRLGDEDNHEAPRPALITTEDFPVRGTRSLLARSLDASWVELQDIEIREARRVEPENVDTGPDQRLPRMEILLSDGKGSEATAWLYQGSAFDLTPGTRVRSLRGFIHAEAPGEYVLLGDKEEDLLL